MMWLVKILELPGRRSYDKILPDKASKTAKNLKYDEYERGAASMVYNISDKKNLWC